MHAAVLLLLGCKLPDSDRQSGVDDTSASVFPALQVKPAAVDFGVVQPNDSATRSLELANVGDANLVLDEPRLQTEDASIGLEWAGDTTVVPGTSTHLLVTWSPEESRVDDTLLIGSNDPITPVVVVGVTGAIPTPQIQVDPSKVDFGHVPVGSSFEQLIAIRNVGDADLHVEALQYVCADPDDLVLELEGNVPPVVVPPGEEFDVSIRYTPGEQGDDQGLLTVQSDDPWSPSVHAEQIGTGVAE